MWFLIRMHNLNIEQWHSLCARSCDFINSWWKSVFKLRSQQSSSVTTKLPFILHLILYSMNELSTFEIDYHFVREKIQLGFIFTRYVKTTKQLGDIITKALSRDRVSYLYSKLAMIDTRMGP